ncbi:acyl carrier protein [Ligilactobacillus faecis]|uniref:acyl carrier protein n=1 Tax=Ligilactobacillus faecis TaxID=762833 RepID=UPI00246966C8|nr:acyl carrier protein [Ligilactobacillus faecis]WGN89099.1 acyl carrier protein [Ligilactobacillus faecis]
MTQEEILTKIQTIVSEQLDVDAAKIVLTANIKEDLDADSLDVFEIMNELEDELEIQLEADEKIQTIQDVVDHVSAQLAANDEA